MSLFTRQDKVETLEVKTFEIISRIEFTESLVNVYYRKSAILPDGSELVMGQFTVTRQIESVPTDIQGLITVLGQVSEKWRLEDIAALK